MFRSRTPAQRQAGPADGQRRAVSLPLAGRDAAGHAGPGGRASELVHGSQDIGRLRYVDEQGLELIEAFHLFPLDADAFDAVIHPQSIVHSLVEYVDGSVLAQLGAPDMRIPIAYTLAYPERIETPCERLDLVRIGALTFEEPDLDRFPALRLAKAALAKGGAAPAILNAANEIAVAAFLQSRIGFLDIATIVSDTLGQYDPPAPRSIEEVLDVDRQARAISTGMVVKDTN
jgi:1-deoxy-D-xylulose-5-phosphate reductoisomerase